MNEAKIRGQLFKMFGRLHLWPITQTDAALCPLCGAKVYPKGGRPDILVLNPTGISIVCEVKKFSSPTSDDWRSSSFPFAKIEDNQRKWLNMWTADSGIAYIGIGMGHQRITTQEDRRRCWLVPWTAWLQVEATVLAAGQKSLPLAMKPRLRKKIAAGTLVAICMLHDYELLWHDGGWTVPSTHPLSVPELRNMKEWRTEWKTD